MPMQPRPRAETVSPELPSRRVGSEVMQRSSTTSYDAPAACQDHDVLKDAKSHQDDLVELRRQLHRIPELGLQIPRTQEAVLTALDGLPLEISTGDSVTSVT